MVPTAGMFALAVVVASVREGRFGPVVAGWFAGQVWAHALRDARAAHPYGQPIGSRKL